MTARRISRLLAQVIDITDGTRHLLELAEQDAWPTVDDQASVRQAQSLLRANGAGRGERGRRVRARD